MTLAHNMCDNLLLKQAHNTEGDKQFKQQLKQSLPSVLRHQLSRTTNKLNIKSNNKQCNVKQQSTSKLTSK
eukprot:7324845-Ditylum_brightwellii.AAC.1